MRIPDEIVTNCSIIVSIFQYGRKNLDCDDQTESSRTFGVQVVRALHIASAFLLTDMLPL